MKIYTKTGDKGDTSLYGGERVSKSDLRIEAYGTVDELNSYIGLLRDLSEEDSETLLKIQDNLFVIGGMLATSMNNKKRWDILPKINHLDIQFIEEQIDNFDQQLLPMTHFILPGGHPIVSHCHIARTICRRSERICVKLSINEDIGAFILEYLNRLSDYLFVLARMLTNRLGVSEVKWIPKKNS